MAKKKIELTTEQIQACEQGFEQAVERDYVTRNSGKRDIDENIYDILEFGCDDVDELFQTDEEMDAAVDYIYANLCN